jgi:drug/metabolite transporter (DMT)-like permease
MSQIDQTEPAVSSIAVIAFAALVAGAVAMAISPVFVRLADVGPFASAFWRVALALPALWAWDRMEGRHASSGNATLPIVLAGLFFAGDLFFWHLSILSTTVANATFFATTAPIWVVLGGWLVLRHRAEGKTLLGLLFAVAGGGALIGESLQIDMTRVTGDLYGVITAVFFGGYFLAIGVARRTAGSARITFLSSVVTAAVLLVVALLFDDRILPRSLDGWLMLVALALVSHAAGQGLLAFSLGHLPTAFSSLVIFLEAIAAAAFGWIILGEELSLLQIAGGAIILFGIWIARPRRAIAPAAVP